MKDDIKPDEKHLLAGDVTVSLMRELEVEKEKNKQLEIELANKKRQDLTGQELLLESVADLARTV